MKVVAVKLNMYSLLTISLVLVSIVVALNHQPALADTWVSTQLTDNMAWDSMSSVSSDGSKIAFCSDIDGDYEIFAINSDGTGLIQLTTNVANDFAPSISGDGTKIAFYSERDGNYEI